MGQKFNNSANGPYFVEGKEFASLPEIANEYGLTKNSVYKRYSRGKRGDDLVPEKKRKNYSPPPAQPIEYKFHVDGRGFTSEMEACRQYKVNYVTYRKRKYAGFSIEECLGLKKIPDKRTVKNTNKKKRKTGGPISLIVDGTEYHSYADLAKAFSLATHVVYQRITRYGYSAEEAVHMIGKDKPITIEDKTYKSLADLARSFNKTPEQVLALINAGNTIEEAIGLKVRETSNSISYKGVLYRSLKDLCDKKNLPYGLISSRVHRGYSLEESINNNFDIQGKYNKTLLARDKELASAESYLYFVKIKIKRKYFYKIGITTKTVEQRFLGVKHEVLYQNKASLIECFNLEQHILEKYNKHRNVDISAGDFDGYTETLDLSAKEITEIINICKKLTS